MRAAGTVDEVGPYQAIERMRYERQRSERSGRGEEETAERDRKLGPATSIEELDSESGVLETDNLSTHPAETPLFRRHTDIAKITVAGFLLETESRTSFISDAERKKLSKIKHQAHHSIPELKNLKIPKTPLEPAPALLSQCQHFDFQSGVVYRVYHPRFYYFWAIFLLFFTKVR